MVSILLGVWNGGGACCYCSARSSACGLCLLLLVHTVRVLLSCCALFLARCMVCGWWTCVCVVRVVGYPLSAPPSSWWRVGPSWMVGCCCGGGAAWWRRGGRCCTDSPVRYRCPPPRSHGGPVEWREVAGCVLSRAGIGSSPSHCSRPFMLSSLLFRLCVAVFVVGGEVRWGGCVPLSSSVFVFSVTALWV